MPTTPHAPLVGRDAECERLLAIVARDGVALVIGEPGIGKTTLSMAAVEAAGRRLVHGGGFATLASVPYLAFQVALGRPVAGDEVTVARQVEAAVRDAVLLVDDLQWVDPATRAVLGLLAGRVALVMTARPDYPHADAPAASETEVIRLGPLPDREAAMIIRRTRPGMGDPDVRRVVARAGGNPLLLQEIARDGRVSTTIARAITAQLELASPEARRGLQILAIADRPVAIAAFPPVVDDLLALGMVTVEDGTVAIRHSVIADTLADGLSPDDRATVHALVAELADDPADRAMHLAGAGRTADAVAVAERALDDTWDIRRRLVLLRLIAGLATGPDALPRRLDAARLALEAEQPAAVVELLQPGVPGDPGLVAIGDGLLGRALAALGQHEAAERALERCRQGLAHDPTGEAEHLLASETAIALAHTGRLGAALEILDQADAGAAGTPELRHRRAGLRSIVRFLEGEAPDFDGMQAAVDDSLRARNPGQAQGHCINLHSMILAHTGPSEALAFAREATPRLSAAGSSAWRLRSEAVQDMVFVGLPAEAVVVADELLEQPLPVPTLTWALVLRAEALVHLGRFDEASGSLARAEPLLADDWFSRGEALTTAAATAYWSGSLRESVAAADRALAVPTLFDANHVVPALTRAWAMADLGQPPAPLPPARPGWLPDGADAEWRALEARSRGDSSCGLFLQAAALWDGRLALRACLCRWAAAEAARLEGAPEALNLLQDALAEAERMGYEPIARRARRSLRLAGVRAPRAAPPVSGSMLLTAREHEILGLVGDGLANIEIARRMGLGRPTVARIVSNAMAKLGAETRAQAVARVQAGPV